VGKQVSLEELDQARSGHPLIIDVRERQEYVTGHVPGAQSMPLGVLAARVDELPKDRPVYVVCQKGGRSLEAAALLSEGGVVARSVAGGTQGWAESGRPIEVGA
jgi:rhodanese-related sulfurtransferase